MITPPHKHKYSRAPMQPQRGMAWHPSTMHGWTPPAFIPPFCKLRFDTAAACTHTNTDMPLPNLPLHLSLLAHLPWHLDRPQQPISSICIAKLQTRTTHHTPAGN